MWYAGQSRHGHIVKQSYEWAGLYRDMTKLNERQFRAWVEGGQCRS